MNYILKSSGNLAGIMQRYLTNSNSEFLGIPISVANFAATLRWRFRIAQVSSQYHLFPECTLDTRITTFRCYTNRSVKLASTVTFKTDSSLPLATSRHGCKKRPLFRKVLVFDGWRAVHRARFGIRIRIAARIARFRPQRFQSHNGSGQFLRMLQRQLWLPGFDQ